MAKDAIDASDFLTDPRHPALLRELAAMGDLRRYRKGTQVITEGEMGETIYIIASGQLKSSSTDASGKEITYGVFGSGEYVGEMALDGSPRSSDCITLAATACYVVTKAQLLQFIGRRPEFALDLLSKVIRRLRATTQSARSLAFIDVYGRLAALLLELSEPHADGTRHLRERVTHEQLASRVGCSREMVSRILKDLERGGYVRKEGRVLVIVKRLPLGW